MSNVHRFMAPGTTPRTAGNDNGRPLVRVKPSDRTPGMFEVMELTTSGWRAKFVFTRRKDADAAAKTLAECIAVARLSSPDHRL